MKYEKQMWLLNMKIQEAGLNRDLKFFIAGGALTSVFSNKPINDLDIFFYTEEDFEKMRNEFGDKGFIPSASTRNAMSYSIVPLGANRPMRVQLIKRYFGTPKEIIDRFDFTICMAAYEPGVSGEGAITIGDDFFYHLSQRTLCFSPRTDYPIGSLWRAKKFIKRDYTFPAIECIKLSLAINNLHIETYEQLKDQLEGIDTYFLKDLTDAMLEKKDEVYDFNEALEFMDKILSQKMQWQDDGDSV